MRVCSVIVTVLAMALMVGCASETKGEKMVQSFNRTKTNVMLADRQVDAVLAALDQFKFTVNQTDAFKNYKAQVATLEEQGTDAKQRAQVMREQFQTYIDSWQKEMKTIDDSTVRASLEARQAAVKENFEKVQASANDVFKAYDPFIRDNKDIVKALSVNLSSATLASLQFKIDSAAKDAKVLKEKLASMQNLLTSIERGQTRGAAAAALVG